MVRQRLYSRKVLFDIADGPPSSKKAAWKLVVLVTHE